MRTPIGAMLLVAGLVLVASGCGKHGADDAVASPKSAVKIVFGEQRNTRPIAEVAKVFDDAPYDFKWATFATPSVEFEAFRSGAIDLASSNDITVLNAANAGLKMKIVAAQAGSFLQKSVGIIVPKDSPIHSVAELKGHHVVVSTARGGSGDNLLHGSLKEAGLKPEDISISYAPFSDGLTAFQTGAVEVLVSNDPYLLVAEQAGGRVLRNGEGINSGLGLIAASEAALADPARRAVIDDVLARLSKAGDWVLQHPDEYAAFLAKDTGLDPKIARLVVERGTVHVQPISEAVIATEQKVADELVARGLWSKPVDVRGFFDASVYTSNTITTTEKQP
jgi:sulfonate transport system substrate-binding protein